MYNFEEQKCIFILHFNLCLPCLSIYLSISIYISIWCYTYKYPTKKPNADQFSINRRETRSKTLFRPCIDAKRNKTKRPKTKQNEFRLVPVDCEARNLLPSKWREARISLKQKLSTDSYRLEHRVLKGLRIAKMKIYII